MENSNYHGYVDLKLTVTHSGDTIFWPDIVKRQQTCFKRKTLCTCLKDPHRVPTGQEVNKVFSKGSTSVHVSNVLWPVNTLFATLATFTHLSHCEKSRETQLTYFTYLLQYTCLHPFRTWPENARGSTMTGGYLGLVQLEIYALYCLTEAMIFFVKSFNT